MSVKLHNGHTLRIARAIESREEARQSFHAAAERVIEDLGELPKEVKHGVKEDIDDAVTYALPSEVIRRHPKTAVVLALACGFGAGALLLPAAVAEVTIAHRARKYGSQIGEGLREKFSDYTSNLFGHDEPSAFSDAAMTQAKGIAKSLAFSLASTAATALLKRMLPADHMRSREFERDSEDLHSYE